MIGDASEALSSLTWESAAWIYSVVIGVVLARYFIFIAKLLQEPKAIKLYYPYLAFSLANILNLYWSWYTAKGMYTLIEGHTLSFTLKTFVDVSGCISALVIVPPDKLLEDFFDMKSWFIKVKRVFCLISILNTLALVVQVVLFYFVADTVGDQQMYIGIIIFILMIMLLFAGTAFSKNVYYISFHGTFMVVFYLYLLYRLSGYSETFVS